MFAKQDPVFKTFVSVVFKHYNWIISLIVRTWEKLCNCLTRTTNSILHCLLELFGLAPHMAGDKCREHLVEWVGQATLLLGEVAAASSKLCVISYKKTIACPQALPRLSALFFWESSVCRKAGVSSPRPPPPCLFLTHSSSSHACCCSNQAG